MEVGGGTTRSLWLELAGMSGLGRGGEQEEEEVQEFGSGKDI